MIWIPPALFLLAFFQSGNAFWEKTFNWVKNSLNMETCNDFFISPDFGKLRGELESNLFGQDIIIEKLVPILKSHFSNQPKKALVICMHGWTGSGKNYATKMVIDNVFRKKTDSQFVRFFNGRLHFPVNSKDYVDHYKVNIQNWIRGNVTNCPRSMFVFDEVDKIPPGILDGIKPFLDYHEKIDSVDYRKSVFIFISNVGGGVINAKFREMWRRGKTRKEMTYKDFEPYLRDSLYKTSGAFYSSSILDGHLVSLYLPFLPLEEEQVRKCIAAEFERQNLASVSEEDVESVLHGMDFNQDRFSTSGCKRVSDLVSGLAYKHFDEL